MNIVLGGAGFIGSHLVDALTGLGQEVTVVDNYSRGKMVNLLAAQETGLLRLRAQNLEVGGTPVQPTGVVWHLAAKVTGIEYNRHHQYEMLRSNLAINYQAIESVRRGRPKLFVYVSTACVYPHDAPVPTPESAADIGNPEPTNHGYGIAKWLGEQMVKHLTIEHNVPCVIVRFFNAFGPRDYYDNETSHVVPALIRRVMEGENPVTVWGTGNQSRVFVDARDIARALVMLSEAEEAVGEVVNIGHAREITIAALVEKIIKLCGKDVGYTFDTTKPDGYPRRAADTTKLRRLIGWEPDTDIDTTLADMIQEYREGRAHL
jgi:GDP-L-fucose synthase